MNTKILAIITAVLLLGLLFGCTQEPINDGNTINVISDSQADNAVANAGTGIGNAADVLDDIDSELTGNTA